MRRFVLWTAAIATALVAAAPARAADGDPYIRSCVTSEAVDGCSTNANLWPYQVAASPDGRELYVTTTTTPGLLRIIDRDPATGTLTIRPGEAGCLGPQNGPPGCTTNLPDVLRGARSIAMSHDGRTLLISSGGAVLQFDRDAGGGLTYAGCAGFGCAQPIQGTPYAVAFSPDDRFVYVRTDGGLDALHRDLSPLACYTLAATSCTQAAGLDGVGDEIGVSQNTVAVSFAGAPGGGVAVFDRLADGTLRPVSGVSGGCYSVEGKSGGNVQCKVGSPSLSSPSEATISPDGRSVFVGGAANASAFRLDADALEPAGCVGLSGDCRQVSGGFSTVRDLLATSDGLILSTFGGRIAYFSRDPATSALTQLPGPLGCMTPDGSNGACQTLAGLDGDGTEQTFLAADPAAVNVYAASDRHGMLASIVRDYGPICHAASVAVPFGTAVPIQLDCADPNGDPLSYAIAGGPTRGSLSGPNGAQVVYTPAAGFSGADQFTYRATGRGVDSAPVTVALGVAPAPPAVAPPVIGVNPPASPAAKRRGTVRALVATRWTVRGARFELMQLTLSALPKHWKAQIRCAGKHCPFKRNTLQGKARHGVANVLRSLKKRQRRFRAGQTLEVWVSAPHLNTKVARLKLKKREIPSTQALCVAPGAVKPQKRCS